MDGGRRVPEQIAGPRAGRTRAPAIRVASRGQEPRPRHQTPPRRSGFFTHITRPGIGWAAATLFLGVTLAYGATLGGHWQNFADLAYSAPNAFARGSGFNIESIEIEGRKTLTDEEILTALDYGPGKSLVTLDVSAARERLMLNPLVLQATIRKLYPNRLVIAVTERDPFALWQQGHKISVIAADGTVMEGVSGGRFANLPLVVGRDANLSARTILAALEPYPDLRSRIYAAVRVGGRRWNLRLSNGIDVKLPEERLVAALAEFERLDRTTKIAERDITEIDLRFEGRPSVRLSDSAATAEAAAAKDKNRRAGT